MTDIITESAKTWIPILVSVAGLLLAHIAFKIMERMDK